MPNSVRVCQEQVYKNEGRRRAGLPERRVKADALDALDASMGPALQKNDLVAWAKADDEFHRHIDDCKERAPLVLSQAPARRKLIGMNFAVLGLGIIGSAWARNLIADGHAVRCWNRTPRVFPNFYPSIQDAVEEAEAIFVIVADPPAVQSVLDQIASHLGPDKIVVQSSTISARWTLQFADQVRRTGASFLEAPFTGSKSAAEDRQTVYYLGGDTELVERMRPVLEPISSAILHIGPLGTASSLKLAMNMHIAGIGQILCESLALCRASGIPDEVYFEALGRNAAHSGLADLKEPKLRQRDYSPQFALKHMDKDLRLALETAADLSLPLDYTRQLKAIYDQGMETGWKDDDFIGLVRLFEKC